MSTPADFAERYGLWAVVTGAAQGIGADFARALAERGLSLVLVDRDAATLSAHADSLRAAVEVREVVVDLAHEGAVEVVLGAMEAVAAGLLVSNAAMTLVSRFVTQDIEALRTQLRVNCEVPLRLVHAAARTFRAQGRGGIVLLSSASALRGAPLVAGYAATKAWTRILAESLWDELRDDGVDVLAVLPGTTRTPGWLATDPQPSAASTDAMEPHEVVDEALAALGRQPSIQPGQANRYAEAFLRDLDEAEAVRIVGQVMRATYPE